MAVDAEAAAARTLCGFMGMLLVLVLGLPALHADSLRVEMAGETQTVLLNHNATISCLVLGTSQLDIKHMAVTWFRKNPVDGTYVKVFEFFGKHQKARRSGADVSLQGLAKGSASLQLPEVQLGEAGEYRCEVVNTPYKDQGTVSLKVVACPVISLSVEKAKVKDNDYLRLLCKAGGFYPNFINITWCEWNQEYSQCLNISENITTNAAIENDNKTFSVTSFLTRKHSPEHGGTYQCMVQHVPLCTPQRRNITLPENACPVISLSVEKAKVKDNDYLRLLCKAGGFHPNFIKITWCKWNQKYSQCLNISENVTTNAAIENDNKTFSVTSFLMLKHSPEHGGTYQCMVQHVPLCTPRKGNITLPENGSESKSDLKYLGIGVPILALLIVVAIFLWKRVERRRHFQAVLPEDERRRRLEQVGLEETIL